MAICRIITGSSARLNEAEGGDIWWQILGNSVCVCGGGCNAVSKHISQNVQVYTHTHTQTHAGILPDFLWM